MSIDTLWILFLAAGAVLAVVLDAWSRPTPPDTDHMQRREREEALRIRQLRLSAAMKRRGVHLLAGKHYQPELTKAARPKLTAISGSKR